MLQPDLIARFTTHLKEALQRALSFAIQNGRTVVEPGDVLVGLLHEQGSIATDILLKYNVSVSDAEARFRGTSAHIEPGSTIAPDLSSAVKKLLEKCVLSAHLFEHKYIGTEHLLFAIIEGNMPDVHAFLNEQGFSMPDVRTELQTLLKSTARFPELPTASNENAEESNVEEPSEEDGAHAHKQRATNGRADKQKASMLQAFGRELTHADVVARLDPVIGRDEETGRVIEILCRRMKNNPILLGEPGVGKTAIVEGLAQRIAAGDVPDLLQGKRVIAVDLALMIAGTMYRGEFEARLKQLVDEVKADTSVILFIDEIHTIVGAGSTSGSLDAANMLKPALARGEIRCIGATTWAEYKKHIEPDAALERRYQVVDVLEPQLHAVRELIKGVKKNYEDHHHVRFTPDALDAALEYAERYVHDRFFPDKVIDALDEAGAHVSAQKTSGETIERLRALSVALAHAVDQKDAAIADGDLPLAAKQQQNEQRLLKEKRTLEKDLAQAREAARTPVTREHIAHVIARQTHIPIDIILQSNRAQLLTIEERLRSAVVGQDEAVKLVAEVLRRARLGLAHPSRPKASLLFVGPSGVGKTELARVMARELFGSEKGLIKLDMSEFAEGHSTSKLLGSPAGYVGYREGNRLTDTIRRHPHAVLLFDEFEKAHPDVQHLLLQALEDGHMTDSTGRKVPFQHAYVVLTSNVGSEYMQRSALGFGGGDTSSTTRTHELVHEQVKERFRPEFLNRLDKVVVFNPLDDAHVRSLFERELQEVLARVQASQHIAIKAERSVLEWLMKQERKAEEGGRAARRIVERDILSSLGSFLLKYPKRASGTLRVVKGAVKIV